jgi:hypothetical protein
MPLLRPLYRWEGEHLVPTGEVPAWADALAAR